MKLREVQALTGLADERIRITFSDVCYTVTGGREQGFQIVQLTFFGQDVMDYCPGRTEALQILEAYAIPYYLPIAGLGKFAGQRYGDLPVLYQKAIVRVAEAQLPARSATHSVELDIAFDDPRHVS